MSVHQHPYSNRGASSPEVTASPPPRASGRLAAATAGLAGTHQGGAAVLQDLHRQLHAAADHAPPEIQVQRQVEVARDAARRRGEGAGVRHGAAPLPVWLTD